MSPARGARRGVSAACACLALVAAWGGPQAADPAAAERQYRVARRLAAEGSAEASAALQRVIDLDPRGALAADALVEQALLDGVARRPEDLGRLDAAAASRAAARVERVLRDFSQDDRVAEARLLRAMLRLEPLPGRDPTAARLDLLTVATLGSTGEQRESARHALGWLDERQGRVDRARGAYQRLVVDAPGSPVAGRARVGLARLDLRAGRHGAAAGWLQEAATSGVADDTGAPALRELAVRSALRAANAGGAWGRPERVGSPGIRALAAMAVAADGSVLLADRRTGLVTRLDARGAAVGRWALAEVQALAVDGMGRAFAASGPQLFALESAGPRPVAALGEFAPVSQLAADALGTIWIVDRRGTRVGRLDPGAGAPAAVWQARDHRASLAVWDGERLLALDDRAGRLFEILPGGQERGVAVGVPVQRPVSMTVDPAGHLAVLDARAATVVLLDPRGAVLERYDCGQSGVPRPQAIALGRDGSLAVFDAATEALWRLP